MIDDGESAGLSIFKRPPTVTKHTLAHFDRSRAAVRDLEAKGVAFIDYSERPLGTTNHIAQIGPALRGWFRDPDGNILGRRRG